MRHIRNQLPASNRLLEKYQYQYKLHRRYESEEEEYEHRTGSWLVKPLSQAGYTRPLALPVLQVLLEFRHEPIAYYR